MEEKYLPIGTVVSIAGNEKNIVIVGYGAYDYNKTIKTTEIYDYCGYPYPEGFCGDEYTIVFNHDAISEIKYKGYTPDTYEQVNKEISEMIENAKKGE